MLALAVRRSYPILYMTLLASLLLVANLQAATYTVSKDGRGVFATIQAAINRAGPNDIVEILDAAVYSEQVTIDSTKYGLTLRSANPSSTQKPVIRYQDILNQDPKTCQDALNPAKINYDQNGALRLLEAENITLEGIEVDGGGAAPFSWPAVWGNGENCLGQLHPLFHGNAALVLFRSARITVRDCTFRNAFFGVDVNDHNAMGAYAILPTMTDLPYSSRLGFRGTGGHFFENCLLNTNTFGVSGRLLQGLPSTFRNNLFFANGHVTYEAARAVKRLLNGDHHPGGAVFMRESPFCPWFFEQNTFASNYLIFSAHYQPNSNHLIEANLFGPPSRYWAADSVFPNPFHELFPALWKGQRRNLIAAQVEKPRVFNQALQFSARDTVTNEIVQYDTTLLDFYLAIRLMNSFGQPELQTDTLHKVLTYDGRQYPSQVVVSRTQPFATVLEMQGDNEAARKQENRWWEPTFASQEPGAASFLEPVWPSPLPFNLNMTPGGYRNRHDTATLPGRIPQSEQAQTLIRVRPLAPVREMGGDLELVFEVEAREYQNGSSIGSLSIMGLVPVVSAPTSASSFGGNIPRATFFHETALPSAPLNLGFNRLRIPRPWAPGSLGMVHMLLRCRNSSGGTGFSEWTSFPAGIIRQDFKVLVNGDTGSTPIDAPMNGPFQVSLSGLPVGPTPVRIRLQRLSGLPLVYVDSSRVDSGWLVSPSVPVELRLGGDIASLRYDAILAYTSSNEAYAPPDYSSQSTLLRFPGAVSAIKSPFPQSKPARISYTRDVLGRRIKPSRILPSSIAPSKMSQERPWGF